jgi:LDH2 family malate/lactate/ureidoglycolate dehydrogenase
MTADDANIAAEAHVWADLRGASAQGIAKLLQYVPRVRSGVTRPDAPVITVHETIGFAMLGARQGWDPVSAMLPMQAATAKPQCAGGSMHASPPAAAVDRALVPGQRGSRVAANRERDGIPIPAERIAWLRVLGDELGVAW